MRRWLVALPLLIAAGLGALFFYGLRGERNPQEIRSVLVGKPMPVFDLPLLGGGRLRSSDFPKDQVVMVNFFASWCVPCRAEHPQLMRLARTHKIPIYGIAWKDSPQNAAKFLGGLGNPFVRVAIDESGRTGINWGVAGVPETYIISADGIVRFRHWGDIRPEHVEGRLLKIIRDVEQP